MTNTLPAGIPGLPMPASMNPKGLSKKAKAAIIVQVILNEGADIDLSDLPESHQAEVTTLLAHMRYVDRETLDSVVNEFADQLSMVGMSFPGDMGQRPERAGWQNFCTNRRPACGAKPECARQAIRGNASTR